MATKARCASCGAAVRAKDRFCSGCGTPIAAAQAPLPAPAGKAGAPPVAEPTVQSASLQVAAHARAALAEHRKVVTVLFADLSGSTPLAEKLDPEELRSIIGAYFSALSRQIQRYEGTVDKYIGDAIMAVFGAPLAHEDDAERAIHAALAMLGSLARLNDDLEREHGVRLALRIGINTGEVVAGLLAGDVQSAYTVVGDAVNTAQRFESVAPLNGILVSESTRRLTVHSFELEALPPVALKGKAEAVPAYRVIRPRDEEIEPDASPLVGREHELERLREGLGGALLGRGRLVHVVGEAGIGKSRLVNEFRAQLTAGVVRIGARCVSYEAQTPYALVSDLIRGVFRIHATDDEATAREALLRGLATDRQSVEESTADVLLEVLGYAERSTFDPEVKRRLLVAILRNVLARAGEIAPFLIAAEDLHWIDGASAAVLADIGKDVPGLPCLFLTTSRPGWSPPWSAETIALEALSDEDARRLIEAIFEAPVDDALNALVRERTGGNPFFIEEVVRELKVTLPLGERAGRVAATALVAQRLPATVQEVLQARLDRLEAGPREVAETAAIVGRSFWYRLLEQLLPGEPLSPHLATLEHETFIVTRAIVPELTYAFRQALVQEVAYHTQLLARRRAGHAAVGRALEDLYPDRLDEFTDLLAYHYGRSGDDAKAVYWLSRAGARAKALYANEEALACYRSALQRLGGREGPVTPAAILEQIGDVQTVIGKYDEALVSFRAAREGNMSERPGSARLQRKIGTALARKGAYSDALAALEEGMAALGDDIEVEAARLGVRIGEIQSRSGNYSAAREALTTAIEVAQRVDADDILAEGLKYLGAVQNYVGDLAGALRLYGRCLAIYDRRGDIAGTAAVRNGIGMLYHRAARWDDALTEFTTALSLEERIGDPWAAAMCHNNVGEVHLYRGDFVAAIAAMQRALNIFTAIGSESEASLALMGLGNARVRSGDLVQGLVDLVEAQRRMSALGKTRYLPAVYRHLAYADLLAGDLQAAASAAERSMEYARAENALSQQAMTERVLGEVALARGDKATARAMLKRSRDRLVELGEVAELERTQALLAKLGE